MRNLWTYRLLGGDALSIVQVGFEERPSRQRGGYVLEAGAADAFYALIA
jgi:hypothetical protein